MNPGKYERREKDEVEEVHRSFSVYNDEIELRRKREQSRSSDNQRKQAKIYINLLK